MAKFKMAMSFVMKYEGKYAFDPNDLGGETYMGISRKAHPMWAGWMIIDVIKHERRLSTNDDIPEVNELVGNFYQVEYWDRLSGDNICDQEIANELMDISIHMTDYVAISFLQEGINMINGVKDNWLDIKVDGIMGKETLAAEEYSRDKGRSSSIVKYINCEQGHRYKKIITNNNKMRRYAVSWYSRT